MIGRGAIDNPWIFRQTKEFRATGTPPPPPDLQERIRVLEEHLRLAVEVKGERKGVIEFRKHYAGYFRGIPRGAKLRAELMQFTELTPVLEAIRRFERQSVSDVLETPAADLTLPSDHG
jgi:tRNA-dihydrouridine synthase B